MIKNDFYITYNNGPKVEINGDTKKEYLVEFIDDFTKKIIHSSTIENNMWTACSREWFTNWVIKINGEIVDRFDLDGKKVRIIHDSKSMGDTIAWAPYAVEFANKHNCKVFLTTHHNEWFKNLPIYKDIEFVGFDFNEDVYVKYNIGWFKNENNNWDNPDLNPTTVNLIPLQQTITDILGLEYKELNYGIDLGRGERPIKDKYVVFGPQATAGCKEWNIDKWNELSVRFIEKGYKVVICSLNSYNIPNTIECNKSLEITATHLKYADIFIGLGSGLSWLNWALGKRTYMINGFAKEGHEFTENLVKITNNKCIKCWNDPIHIFDPSDWNWCPVYKGTKLQHICQQSITVDQVLKSITPKRVLVKITSSSLGDTIAAIPYIDKYRIDNNCSVSVKMNQKYVNIIKDSYSNLNYVNNESGFDDIIPVNYNFYSRLQEGFALDLGYTNWEYLKPKLNIKPKKRPIKKKYVVINVHSTSQLKYWNHPGGEKVRNNALYWTELCNMLKNNGLTPVIVELNESFGTPPYFNGLPKGFISKIGKPLEEVVNYIQHAEFFIGLSSGLAWLAHALNTKIAIIANFTDKEHEIPLSEPNYKRINNEAVCNGCFNKTKHKFNSGDWEWCPEHKNTDRQFECHTSITPKQVFNEIKEWI